MTLSIDATEVREHSAEKAACADQVGVLEGVCSSVCKNDFSNLGCGGLNGSHCSGQGSVSDCGCHSQPVVQRGLDGGDAGCRHKCSLVLPEEADSSGVEGVPSVRVLKVVSVCTSQTGLSEMDTPLWRRNLGLGCWYTSAGNV